MLLPRVNASRQSRKLCLAQVLGRGYTGQVPATDHPDAGAYGGQWLVDGPSDEGILYAE